MSGAASGKRRRGAARRGRGGGRLLLPALFCLVAVALAPGASLLLGVLLLPAGLLLLVPGNHGGARVVQACLLCGLAGSVRPMARLWQSDAAVATALEMLRHPAVLLTAWVSMCAGWLLAEAATAALRIRADLVAARERRAMTARIEAIEAEWGPLPASAPLPPL